MTGGVVGATVVGGVVGGVFTGGVVGGGVVVTATWWKVAVTDTALFNATVHVP